MTFKKKDSVLSSDQSKRVSFWQEIQCIKGGYKSFGIPTVQQWYLFLPFNLGWSHDLFSATGYDGVDAGELPGVQSFLPLLHCSLCTPPGMLLASQFRNASYEKENQGTWPTTSTTASHLISHCGCSGQVALRCSWFQSTYTE